MASMVLDIEQMLKRTMTMEVSVSTRRVQVPVGALRSMHWTTIRLMYTLMHEKGDMWTMK